MSVKRRRAKLPAPRLEWQSVAQFATTIHRAGRTLLLGIQHQRGEWMAVALEGPMEAAEPEDVFADHGHAMLGFYRSPCEAFAAAESYADAWMRGHKVAQIDGCNCEAIT